MVILNESVPINYNYMKKIFLSEVDQKIINVLDNIFYNHSEKDRNKYNIYIKNIKEEIKNIMDLNHFVDLSMNHNYCNYIYKNGKYEGMICCAKIFIKTNDRKQRYLCSRHCRDYNTKPRIYDEFHKRCSYKRNNGNICKHICEKNKIYCYIHKDKEKRENAKTLENSHSNLDNFNIYEKNLFLKKLEEKRKKYFLRKHNRYKNTNNNAITKYNKNQKISKILNFHNFSKFFNIYNYDYIYYNYYNKTRYKQ